VLPAPIGGLFVFRRSPLAASIPTDIPSSLTAGDTWQWTRTYADYLAGDGWTLTYYLRGASMLDIEAEADGDGFEITADADDTTAIAAGVYQYIARVEGTTGTFTVGSGSVVILPNVATAVAGDHQSFAEQMVSALETALLANVATAAAGGSGGLVLSYTIANRSVTFRDEAELRAQLSHYKWQVWREKNPGRLAPRRQVRFVA
jgi:hypothetical protein